MHTQKIEHKGLERSRVVGKDEVGPNHVVGVFEDARAARYQSGALHNSQLKPFIELVLCFLRASKRMFLCIKRNEWKQSKKEILLQSFLVAGLKNILP